MKISSCLAISVFCSAMIACQPSQRQSENAPLVDESNDLEINLRKRVSQDEELEWEPVEFKEQWEPEKTAFIITDMWDRHWCESATQRVNELAPRMNETISMAREKGVIIIHAPSGTMDFYRDAPQRNKAINVPHHDAPEDFPINDWCYLDTNQEAPLPIDDSDGGCDQPCEGGQPCVEMTAWTRQTPDIDISEQDYITDRGQEVFNILTEHEIDNIVVMGVHLNMCVLGRPFAIRQMANLNKNVVLMRDMTDTMYNPEMPPNVSHFEGTELVVNHVEKYWAPTVLSTDFTGKPAFTFDGQGKSF